MKKFLRKPIPILYAALLKLSVASLSPRSTGSRRLSSGICLCLILSRFISLSDCRWRRWYSSSHDLHCPTQSRYYVSALPSHSRIMDALANYAVCAFTCSRWNLEWQSSDAHFRPIFVGHWGPSYLCVRPTAIRKGFSSPFPRFPQLRWRALGRGLQFRKSSVSLSPALWVPAENCFGTHFRSIYRLFEFVVLCTS